MDKYINPEDFLRSQRAKLEREVEKRRNFPENPERDVLLFLIDYAPLENWQLDILSIVRDEAYYFAPQAQTKIMNEGWASYWHSKIMTQKCLKDSEVIDYADHHSGTLSTRPGRINPYKLGVELFRDIEDRWNKGKFGKEYEECDSLAEKKNWDRKLGLGIQKIFEVRKIYNDVMFIDAFLTEEFCREQKLFTYRYNEQTRMYEIADRDFKKIKKSLLFSLTNFGQPFIYIIDANHGNRGELYLQHRYEGIELRVNYAKDTLRNLYELWRRPVHLETVINDKKILFSFDGKGHEEKRV
jgi:stage V sporulation protein R